jgi:hypothetical protein
MKYRTLSQTAVFVPQSADGTLPFKRAHAHDRSGRQRRERCGSSDPIDLCGEHYPIGQSQSQDSQGYKTEAEAMIVPGPIPIAYGTLSFGQNTILCL